MSFISYSQNFEDVLLWRALGNVRDGFYIDVGAWSHEVDSVTRAFYERGWSGMNIEPEAGMFQQLQENRLRDVNLRLAISDRTGHDVMYLINGTGLSTLDSHIAEAHKANGYYPKATDVKVETLKSVWHRYVPCSQEVHFLKVDVEGAECRVLESNDWELHRPWVVVVESTLPGTQVECHHVWENVLLKNRYKFVYSDGLNRFYIAEEKSGLGSAFQHPPNVFDGFITLAHYKAEKEAKRAIESEICVSERASKLLGELKKKSEQLRACRQRRENDEAQIAVYQSQKIQLNNQLKACEESVARLTAASQQLTASADSAENELRAVYASKSWRLTSGLRRLYDLLQKPVTLVNCTDPFQVNATKSSVRGLLLTLMSIGLRLTFVRRLLPLLLGHFPAIKAKLNRLVRDQQARQGARSIAREVPANIQAPDSDAEVEPKGSLPLLQSRGAAASLSSSARRFFHQLKHAAHTQERGQH